MSTIRDKATVELFVNGEQPKKILSDLKTEAVRLRQAVKSADEAGDLKAFKKAKSDLEKTERQIRKMESAFAGVGQVMKDLDKTTLTGLNNALRVLKAELRTTTPNTAAWNELSEKINTVKARISELNTEIGESQSMWKRYSTWTQQIWPSIDLLVRGYDAVVSGLREYVDAFAEMDQEMANVRKFTGMTEDQVADLNEEFKKIDTRTSREDLNKLAQEAGRLGKTSSEDVLGFVRAADKINVALDDLGDGATLTLSKLTGIFGDEARYGTERSLLKVGSVINELSQNCSASAPYIANFTERLGGVGAQANMTISQIMGFGAVLDSNSQKVEASATALSQVIVRMMQDPAKYARVAGLEVTHFTELLKKDTNAALILFLETLQKAGGMDVLSPMFKDMGENGSGAIAALSTLADKIDQVKQQQEAAAIAFEEGTSIDKEFAVQNETAAASLDKAKKRAQEIRVELGEKLYPLMSHFLTTSSAVMRALLVTINFVEKHKKEVIAVTAAVTGYTVVVKGAVIVEKSLNTLKIARIALLKSEAIGSKTLAVATAALTTGYYRATGQMRKAAIAQRELSAAMASTPWGALITALGAGVIAWHAFNSEVDKNKELTEAQNQAKAQSAAKIKEEEVALESMIKRMKAFTGTKEQEINLVGQLNTKYGPVLGTYSTLSEWMETLTTRGDEYVANISKQIAAEAKLEQSRQLIAKAAKLRSEGYLEEADSRLSNIMDYIEANLSEIKYLPSGNARYHSFEEIINENAKKALARVDEKASQLEEQAKLLRESIDMASELGTEPVDNLENPDGEGNPPPSGESPARAADRFADEDNFKTRAEAEARIRYAKGESDYQEHTETMTHIAIAYYQQLLERTDLSESERMDIQAKYWEAINSDTVASAKQALDAEEKAHDDLLIALKRQLADKLDAENMSAQERMRIEKENEEAVEMATLEHMRRLVQLTEAGSEERAKAEADYETARLNAQKRHASAHEKEVADRQKAYDKYFGDMPDEKKGKYDAAVSELDAIYNEEVLRAAGNNERLLQLDEAYQKAKLMLAQQYGQQGADSASGSYKDAIKSSAEWLQGEGGQALMGTMSTLSNGLGSIFSGLSSVVQAELDIQTAAIERRYDLETRRAQGNAYMLANIEKKKEKDLAKAKNEANRKMFAMQVIQAVAQTATNALNAYGSAAAIPVVGHVLAPIAAAMAVAAGMLQVQAIKKQQKASESQGYSKGGFTRPGRVDEPAGVVHAGEWVASQKLLASPVARPMIDALDYAQRTNTIGSLRTEDVSRSINAPAELSRIAGSDSSGALVVAAVAQSSEAVSALTKRLNEPFVTVNTVTGDKGINETREEYDRLMANKSSFRAKRKKNKS